MSNSRDESPRETDGDLSEGIQAMEIAAEGLEIAAERVPRREQHEIRGGDRRRVADSGRQAGRGSALVDQQYRPLRHGRDGGSSGRRYAPAGRSGNTASGTSGWEYANDSARRSRTRGRRAHSVAISPPLPDLRPGSASRSGGPGDQEGTVEFLLAEGLLKKTRENELKFTQRCFHRLFC